MEELITVKLVLRQRATELNELLAEFDVWKKRWQAVRGSVAEERQGPRADVWLVEPPPVDEAAEARRRGDDKVLEYLDWNKAFVTDIAARIARLTAGSESDQRSLGPLVEDLLDDVKTLVMLPFSSLSQAFPKMVRDLARAEGKAVDLTVTGGDIEIDRHVLETIKDPIIHILRNCVGHGVETPDVRAKRGKPVRGQVTIAVTRVEGNKLSIVVADDGGGIDISGVRQIAGKVGARSQDHIDSLDDEQAMTLVFESGVSTNPIVTDVSGRGIGLAIVQEKVEQLGGVTTVRSEPGKGTSFELVVPATLASSRGVLVRVADRLFVLPTLHVDRVTRVDPRDIATVENSDTVTMDGQAVAFAFLHDVLDLPRKPRSDDVAMLPVVVLMSGNERVAFAVDWVLGDQEVLVKSLGPQLENLRYVTGATVLESDKIALILHPPEVIRAAAHGTDAEHAGRGPLRRGRGAAQEAHPRRRGLDHLAHAAQEHPRDDGLRGAHGGRRSRGAHGAHGRGVRPAHLRRRDAAHERLRPHGPDPGRRQARRPAGDAGHQSRVARGPREGRRRGRQRLHHQGELRPDDAPRDRSPARLGGAGMIDVLLVDDSAEVRAGLRRLLAAQPDIAVVGEAASGREALRMIAVLKPDVVLMDADMPGMDGFETTVEVMARSAMPIIIVSAHEDAGEADKAFRAMEAGAVALVALPSGTGESHGRREADIVQTVRAMAEVRVVRRRRRAPRRRRPASPRRRPREATSTSSPSAPRPAARKPCNACWRACPTTCRPRWSSCSTSRPTFRRAS